MIRATILYPLDERVVTVFAAEEKDIGRASYTVTTTNSHVVFEIVAQDATSLRAATTTITKVLSMWEASALHGN